MVEPIINPVLDNNNHRFFYTYSKLRIFEEIYFDKIVFLDSYMLICQNIDELFDKPHWSAVNARGWLQENSTWELFNSG